MHDFQLQLALKEVSAHFSSPQTVERIRESIRLVKKQNVMETFKIAPFSMGIPTLHIFDILEKSHNSMPTPFRLTLLLTQFRKAPGST